MQNIKHYGKSLDRMGRMTVAVFPFDYQGKWKKTPQIIAKNKQKEWNVINLAVFNKLGFRNSGHTVM